MSDNYVLKVMPEMNASGYRKKGGRLEFLNVIELRVSELPTSTC